jgi:spermidine synthase
VTAGFVVLPALGLRGGLLLAAAGYVALARLIAPPRSRVASLGWAALAAVGVVAIARTPLTPLQPGETLRAAAAGPGAMVTVVDTGDDLQLRVDGYYTLGGSAAATTERRQGLVPLLLHPAPRRVAFVGMATGISASAAPALGVEETTVVELIPEVAAAAAAYFVPWNGGLLERPDVRLVVDDGRRFLAAGGQPFDVIVGDLFIPWHAGAGTLYARETFAAAARRLAPGGLFCQWLPLYQLTREEFGVIARTFLGVFPHVGVWRDDFYPDRPVVALMGTMEPPALDVERLGERIGALPGWSRDALLAEPRGLLMLSAGDLSAAPDLAGTGPIDTDDRPVIEFLAPRLTRMGPEGDKDWFTGEQLTDWIAALAERSPSGSDDVASARRAGLALARYAVAARRGDVVAAGRFRDEVRDLVPEVVAADGDAATPLADARRTLARLREDQDLLQRRVEAIEHRLLDPRETP